MQVGVNLNQPAKRDPLGKEIAIGLYVSVVVVIFPVFTGHVVLQRAKTM